MSLPGIFNVSVCVGHTHSQAAWGGLWRPTKDPYGPGSFVQCSNPGALPYDPEKAKELIKAYGKPVEFKMVVTATPRGREVGQIFEFWRNVGANVTIDQTDQTALVTKAFRRDFQLTSWRIIDLADPNPQMYANFHTGSPVNLANYSNPEAERRLEFIKSSARLDGGYRDPKSMAFCFLHFSDRVGLLDCSRAVLDRFRPC